MNFADFTETSPGCFIHNRHIESFKALGLEGVDDFVGFTGGEGINTKVLPKFRRRLAFKAGSPSAKFYLKSYNHPPLHLQISNWLDHRKLACTAAYDYRPALELAEIGIKTPVVAAFGERMGTLFEKKSFVVTEEITGAESLENNPPEFFRLPINTDKRKKQRRFIEDLALMTRKFHQNGFCHRDFYLCHIFWGEQTGFQLIDLQRVFKPTITAGKYRIKDIAQLYYSAPKSVYSQTMRLRFYKKYAGKSRLTFKDKWFIKRVKAKAERMASHDTKRARPAPFRV